MKQYQADTESEMPDVAKTVAEHQEIIIICQETGLLDRDDAIKKYDDFIVKHPGYRAYMKLKAAVEQAQIVPMGSLPDDVIAGNPQSQPDYLNLEKISESRGKA